MLGVAVYGGKISHFSDFSYYFFTVWLNEDRKQGASLLTIRNIVWTVSYPGATISVRLSLFLIVSPDKVGDT